MWVSCSNIDHTVIQNLPLEVYGLQTKDSWVSISWSDTNIHVYSIRSLKHTCSSPFPYTRPINGRVRSSTVYSKSQKFNSQTQTFIPTKCSWYTVYHHNCSPSKCHVSSINQFFCSTMMQTSQCDYTQE